MPRRRVAAVAALLAIVLSACGTAQDTPEALRESAGSVGQETSTTTSAPEAATTSTTGRTTTSSPATTDTTRPVPTTAPPTTGPRTAGAPAPRPLFPPAAGTYRYDTAGRSTFAGHTVAFPAVTSLIVEPPSGTRQRSTRDLRDAAGNGLATELLLDYRAEGVYLLSLRLIVGFNGITDARDLRPTSPVLLLATGARPGARLEADLTGTSAAKLVVDVVGEERVTVGGQAVDTLVLRAVITLAPGDVTGRQELTFNVDRGSRLWVRERAVTDASAAGGLFTFHSEYTATLQRLTP